MREALACLPVCRFIIHPRLLIIVTPRGIEIMGVTKGRNLMHLTATQRSMRHTLP